MNPALRISTSGSSSSGAEGTSVGAWPLSSAGRQRPRSKMPSPETTELLLEEAAPNKCNGDGREGTEVPNKSQGARRPAQATWSTGTTSVPCEREHFFNKFIVHKAACLTPYCPLGLSGQRDTKPSQVLSHVPCSVSQQPQGCALHPPEMAKSSQLTRLRMALKVKV